MTQGANDTARQELMSEIRQFGRDAAAGKDSLPMLAIKVAYAVTAGTLTLDKNADGDDDIGIVYAEYLKALSKKQVHEHTPGGLKANTSKLRQIAVASSMTTADFQASLNRLIIKRDEMQATEGVKVRPAYAAIVEAARTQIAQPDDITEGQIEECIKKPEPSEKTVAGELKRAEKILADLISGDCGVKDDSPEIVEAHGKVAEKMAALMLTKDLEATIAKAQSLGLTVVAPVTCEVTDVAEAA